jgi:hypothetical protein
MSKGKNRQFARRQVRAVLKNNPLATPKGSAGKLARISYGGGLNNSKVNDTYTDRDE